MYDKRIYCDKCKRETLHQVTKASKSKESGNDEMGSPDCSYYDYGQCLACGKETKYGCFFVASAELEPPNPDNAPTPAETT